MCDSQYFPSVAITSPVALAPSPVLVGYSLVGVYPCAVWKPRRLHGAQRNPSCVCTASASTSPSTRGLRVASTVRAVPYPLPAQLYQFPPAASVAVPAAVVPRVASASSNPLPATLQQPQTPQQQEQCRCRGGSDEDGGCGDTAVPPTTTPNTTAISLNTPMLFVPFSVPNLAPPLAGTNSTSPSGGTTPAKVGTLPW